MKIWGFLSGVSRASFNGILSWIWIFFRLGTEDRVRQFGEYCSDMPEGTAGGLRQFIYAYSYSKTSSTLI